MNTIPSGFQAAIQAQLEHSNFEEFLNSLQNSPPVSIRLNPKKQASAQTSNQPIPWCRNGFYLSQRPSFTLDPALHAGGYYVQEASSMFLEQAILHSVNVDQPLRALDLCAAPGGKSTHLISLLNSESLLISNEVIRSRAGILSENMVKWGNANNIITSNDPETFGTLSGYFDLMVIDAPCSGEGLFRKEPEAMDSWSPAHVELCSQRQRRILADTFPALKQNGILIYSTCTFNRVENEENLKWLQNNRAIECLRIPLKPEWGIQEVDEGGIIGYRFYPHRVKGEGFFLSVIRKLETEKEISFKSKEKIKPLKESEKVKDWIKQSDSFHFFQRPEGLRIIPKDYAIDLEGLAKNLYIIQAGTLLGSFKHEKFVPDHALAVSNHFVRDSHQVISVSLDEALSYLRKENLSPPDVQSRGYALLTYQDLGLGWVNLLGNRMNNLYPVNWRIRMK